MLRWPVQWHLAVATKLIPKRDLSSTPGTLIPLLHRNLLFNPGLYECSVRIIQRVELKGNTLGINFRRASLGWTNNSLEGSTEQVCINELISLPIYQYCMITIRLVILMP